MELFILNPPHHISAHPGMRNFILGELETWIFNISSSLLLASSNETGHVTKEGGSAVSRKRSISRETKQRMINLKLFVYNEWNMRSIGSRYIGIKVFNIIFIREEFQQIQKYKYIITLNQEWWCWKASSNASRDVIIIPSWQASESKCDN